MTVQEIFQFYADEVKPALAKAQVSENALPVELLNEIHAAFDHLGHVDMAFTRTRYSKAGREAEQFAAIRKRYQRLLEWLDDCPLA